MRLGAGQGHVFRPCWNCQARVNFLRGAWRDEGGRKHRCGRRKKTPSANAPISTADHRTSGKWHTGAYYAPYTGTRTTPPWEGPSLWDETNRRWREESEMGEEMKRRPPWEWEQIELFGSAA